MGTLSLVLEYLKDLEEYMDDGDSRVAKESKLFYALEHKSVVIEVDNHKIAIFTKAPLWAFGEPFMRYSLPCKVEGQGSWDVELDITDSANYVTEKVLEIIGFMHVSLSDYGRKMVNDINVEIHGIKFKDDFVVLDYVNEGEPSILFGRDFLATTKSQVDFVFGEIRMNLTMFEEGIDVIDLLEEVGSLREELVKMGKKKEKMKEVLDIKYKELEESKPILEVLENYVMYKKKLDEILIGKERHNKKEFSEEFKVGIIKHDLGLGDPRPYQMNLTIADNTQAKAMGEVKNVMIQIGYQAYVVDLLILDIPVDPKLPLLLGRPFLRTCRAIIDMGRAFKMEGEDDWLGSFEVGRDEDRNMKYGPVVPSFIDIKDDMEKALAMEAYFNPFKNVIVFKKLVDFFGSLPVQLKNLDWGNKGYGTYKKVDGEKDTLLNPLISEYERRNTRNTITYSLQLVSNANLKWRDLPSGERHAYCEKLSKLQESSFEVLRVANCCLFDGYGFEDTLREIMKLEYIYEGDGDIFVDYSWERELSIDNEIYPEWVLEYFSTLYFDKDVDRNNLMKEKFIWLEVDDKQFDHKDYWTRVGKPTLTNYKEVLVKEPLMRIMHKVIVGSLIKKCSEPIDCEYWISKMLADELDVENTCLKKETKMPPQAEEGSSELRQEHRGLNLSWRDWNASLSEIKRGNVWRDSMLI
ncbi:hypothetical protein Tco_1102248 [Tanacetum coccineum]